MIIIEIVFQTVQLFALGNAWGRPSHVINIILVAMCIVFHYVDIISWFRSRTFRSVYYLLFHTTFGCGGGTLGGNPGMEGEEALALLPVLMR